LILLAIEGAQDGILNKKWVFLAILGENDGDPLELAPFHLGFALWEPHGTTKKLKHRGFPLGKIKNDLRQIQVSHRPAWHHLHPPRATNIFKRFPT